MIKDLASDTANGRPYRPKFLHVNTTVTGNISFHLFRIAANPTVRHFI